MNLTSASRHWNDLRLLVEPRHQARTCVSASFRPRCFMPAVKRWILHFQRLQIIFLGSLYGFVAQYPTELPRRLLRILQKLPE